MKCGCTTANQRTAVRVQDEYTWHPPLHCSSYLNQQWDSLCPHFWNLQRQMFDPSWERSTLINTEIHGDVSCDRLNMAIWIKHRDYLFKGMVLLQDSACPMLVLMCWNTRWPMLWDYRTSAVEPWPCCIKVSFALTLQSFFKEVLCCQQLWPVGGIAYVSCCRVGYSFPSDIRKPVQHRTKYDWTARCLCWRLMHLWIMRCSYGNFLNTFQIPTLIVHVSFFLFL
jgi:hypothetical protein